mgnify:CR=1 FL=1
MEDGLIRRIGWSKNINVSNLMLQRSTKILPPMRTELVALIEPTSRWRHARQSPADRSGVHCARE